MSTKSKPKCLPVFRSQVSHKIYISKNHDLKTMTALPKPIYELKEPSALEEESQEEEKSNNDAPEKVVPNDESDAAEDQENICSPETKKKIKSIKSDLGLILFNENDKEINENVKVEVDKNKKCNSGCDEEESVPPALPPRPPLRPRQPCSCACELDERNTEERNEGRVTRSCWANGLRKYVFLCTACGSLSILLGALFLIVYFMLKSYTSSLNHFETIPTYVPSGMLIATGFLIICLACRKNRNSFLMKLCGLCSLCCAVLCVSVTVTTTVIHMNRLQTLRECLYTLKTQSCTCYSVLMDNDRISDEGIKFVFNSTPDCEVIHGALYSCLRAIFGLSVIGILVCIFSCMLVYQLLSHEKKKMYWAQLEMRCRYLYRQQRNPHYYSCCDECRYPPHPHELFPWDLMGNRFWSSGRIGNLYTPNPEDRGNHSRLRSGWNWRRLPWSRSGTNSNEPNRANLGSPDSQYGFSSTPTVDGTPYTVLDPRTTAGIPTCHAGISSTADVAEGGFYSWGPPPPYASNRNSANNSPARRSLGDILHQVSPIRRNDNVSPARGMHHVHRHHLHHNRQCGSSSRQMPSNAQNQPDSLQKTTLLRTTPITNAIQQQQAGMDPLWSNSLSSVHRFQKVIHNKTNYENMYDSENILPTNGFNTLPSLKKRNQPRMSDIFQDETSTAYFFSSAENLGCSTSNIKIQTQNENLPPRVFLKSSQPNTSIHPATSMTQNFSFKSQNSLNVVESSNPPENTEGSSVIIGNRPFRSLDCNTSLVKKLFVNCSPSKQKPRNSQNSRCLADRGQNIIQTPKKKVSKRLEPKDIGMEAGNENVITFHYRVGIPRSPDIQDFNQFLDKSPYIKNSQDGSGNGLPKGKISDSEVSKVESQKVSKSTKYVTKELELLQNHRSLMKEFNKNLDLQNKYKSNRTDNLNNTGIDSENYTQEIDSTEELKQNYPKNLNSNMRHSPGIGHSSTENRPNFQTNESPANEDYLMGNIKPNENESDVYFGDISNSSCYMSLQNDGLESLMYEEAAEQRMHLTKFLSNGHPVLSKQNLKIMENESLGFNDIMQRHESQSEGKNSNRHQNVQDSTQQNCRHHNSRLSPHHQTPDEKAEENSLDSSKQEPKQLEVLNKTSRRLINSTRTTNESLDKLKYFQGMKGHYRQSDHHVECVNSNDEQSSGSLTADSGISTGRSFMPTCFENTYHEIGVKGTENENLDERGDNFDEKFPPFTNKISNLDFSHPLFQKPKVLPRGNRYKELELRQKKKFEVEDSESGNDGELDCQNKRKKNFPSKTKSLVEVDEEISNQLLSTCNLTLTRNPDNFLEDDKFDVLSKNQEKLPVQEQDFQVTLRKSPKPLPRTSVLNKSSGENSDHNLGKTSRHLQDKEKLGHFLAPDAQYEFQENFKGNTKPKTPIKAQALTKVKPAVPARPFNLQIEHKKNGKVDNLSVRMFRGNNESGRPVPRRRKHELEDSERKESEMSSHSVNV